MRRPSYHSCLAGKGGCQAAMDGGFLDGVPQKVRKFRQENHARMKRNVYKATLLVFAAGLSLTLCGCLGRPAVSLDQKMEQLVRGVLEKNKSIHNCVLAVDKGDDSFSWAGAAGIAHQDGQVSMTGDTPIYLASITKLYTATAVMRLVEMGALSLKDPMSKYLPEELIHRIHVYKGKDYSQQITIEQLLAHTSGIADYYSEKPKNGKSLFELFLEEPERPWRVEETIERARKDLKPNFAPGTGASYSDTNYQLLGKVIEAVSGKPLHRVYEELFFRPLGLSHTYLVGYSEGQPAPVAAPADVFYKDTNITRTRANGAYWADGGIVSTAEEMVRFLRALNTGQIIRADTLKLMHDWHRLEFPFRYGYGTMYFKLPGVARMVMQVPPMWGHSGSTGSFLYYDEGADLYMGGSVDQVEARMAPFTLMGRVARAIQSPRS
jgi:D-alanyl-D-alanine carboxypeptidase